jgi:hypothetical protein
LRAQLLRQIAEDAGLGGGGRRRRRRRRRRRGDRLGWRGGVLQEVL